MSFPEGQIQYIEFASSDMSAQKEFYQAAFGWEFTDWGEGYTSFEGDHVHCGFYPGEVSKGSILPIIYLNDLEVLLEKVKAAGGTIVKEIFTFPGGKRFHFTDPDGNELAVWTMVK